MALMSLLLADARLDGHNNDFTPLAPCTYRVHSWNDPGGPLLPPLLMAAQNCHTASCIQVLIQYFGVLVLFIVLTSISLVKLITVDSLVRRLLSVLDLMDLHSIIFMKLNLGRFELTRQSSWSHSQPGEHEARCTW